MYMYVSWKIQKHDILHFLSSYTHFLKHWVHPAGFDQ